MLKLVSSFDASQRQIKLEITGENKAEFLVAASIRHALSGAVEQITRIANKDPKRALEVCCLLHELCKCIVRTMQMDSADFY